MEDKQLVKVCRISNPKNVLIQIPGNIIKMWGLEKDDSLEVVVCSKTGNLIVIPKKGYIHVKPAE